MKKTIRLYYIFQFFFPLLLWLPIFYEYQKRMGLDDSQIFGIQSLYYLAFFVLEIPTGAFSDIWGYRRGLRIGAAALVISNLLPIFVTSYSGFLIHFILIAIARSFVSGTSNAYLYEYLTSLNAREHYKQIEGNARAYGLAGKVVCWSAIGALMQWHITLPYWLTALCAVIALLAVLKFPHQSTFQKSDLEAQKTEPKISPKNYISNYLSPILKSLWNSPYLLLLMFQGIGIFVLGRICQINLYQPILEDKKFDIVSYGWIMAIMTLFEAIGSKYHKWTRKFLTDLNVVFAITAIIALSLSLMAFSGKTGTMVALFLFAYASGVAYPLQKHLMNEAITDSRYRATLLSIESLINRSMCAYIVTFIAPFVAMGQTGLFLNISAAATILYGGIIFMLMRRYKCPAEK